MPIGYLLTTLFAAAITSLSLWPRAHARTARHAGLRAGIRLQRAPLRGLLLAGALDAARHRPGRHRLTGRLDWARRRGGHDGGSWPSSCGEPSAHARRSATRWRRASAPTGGSAARSGAAVPAPHEPGAPAGASDRAAPLPSAGRAAQRNIAYGPAGQANLLDLYRPPLPSRRVPAFIYFHPGGFFSGRKSREARPIFDQLVRPGGYASAPTTGSVERELSEQPRRRRSASSPGCAATPTSTAPTPDRDRRRGLGRRPPGRHVRAHRERPEVPARASRTQTHPSPPRSGSTASTVRHRPPSIPSSPGDYARADAPPFLVIHGERDPMVPANRGSTLRRAVAGRVLEPGRLRGAAGWTAQLRPLSLDPLRRGRGRDRGLHRLGAIDATVVTWKVMGPRVPAVSRRGVARAPRGNPRGALRAAALKDRRR